MTENATRRGAADWINSRWVFVLGPLLFVAVVLFFVVSSEPYQQCLSHGADSGTTEVSKHDASIFSPSTRETSFKWTSYSNCTLSFFERYSDAIVALGTVFVAMFTFTLWYSTRGLWLAAQRQSKDMAASLEISHGSLTATQGALDLANKEFVATHRPRLHVRQIHFDGDHGTFVPQNVSLWLVNVGETAALFIEAQFVAGQTEGGAWIGRQIPILEQPIQTNELIQPGDTYRFDAAFGPPMGTADLVEINAGRRVLNVIGLLRYKDALGTIRQTGFCWPYVYKHKDFRMPQPPVRDEYNFED